MEFEKSRVYTALNADELPIGSKCIFADTLGALSAKVQSEEYKDFITILKRIYNDGFYNRFDTGDDLFCFAYLIESSSKPMYKTFSSSGKALEVIKAHDGRIKEKETGEFCFITFIGSDSNILVVSTNNGLYTSDTLLACFVFADDGSPCGELVGK